MRINPILACDFYKTGHVAQYPAGLAELYSNFTPRSDKLAPEGLLGSKPGAVVNVGLQGFIQWFLIEAFNEEFFKKSKESVLARYRYRMQTSIAPDVSVDHIAALHDLGYLPLEIKALPEGALVDIKVPLFTVQNTHPDFAWLVNYIETAMSAEVWKACTTATTAFMYRDILEYYAEVTGAPKDFVLWQGHDFSMRGLSGLFDGMTSAWGHLAVFLGTDTIPAIQYIEDYYGGLNTFVGGSVPASEHSVASSNILAIEKQLQSEGFVGNTKLEAEKRFFLRYCTEIYPSGVASYVSDTYDFFGVLTEVATDPVIKQAILDRKENALGLAKIVFRPDSGDPLKIICGDADAKVGSPEYKGALQLLWETFGGTINAEGYKMLNPRVGLIYGDSITLERAAAILSVMKVQGFCSSNVVFGIGSYTYNYCTRDTHGFAMKATYAEVNGVTVELYKDPKTDAGGTKKSAKGLLRVEETADGYVLFDQQTPEQEKQGALQTVFKDGKLYNFQTIDMIRARINKHF
jgi:nicotinamide phosphoribosyltransferase